MTKKKIKELEEKMRNFKPKYIYNRYDGVIRKYEVVDNILINVKNTNDIIDRERHGILGITSENLIDLIEVGDYVNGVEVVDLADGIHLEFANDVSFVDVGLCTYMDGHIEGIETIVTKEQFKNIEYIVED